VRKHVDASTDKVLEMEFRLKTTEKRAKKSRAVIVGGGITGVAALIGLIEHRAVSEIFIIDPGTIGIGRAFATTEAELLCNTTVEMMSIISHDKEDFVKYLRARGFRTTKNDFVPRFYVSQYARDRYQQFVEQAQILGITHQHLLRIATAVIKCIDGSYRVIMNDGNELSATDVLLCHGYGSPLIPEVIKPHMDKPLVFSTPYPEQAMLNAIPPGSRILIIGTRLSAIDATLMLCSHGHRVVMTSRTGELPSVRTRTPRSLTSCIDERKFSTLDIASPAFASRLLRIIGKAVTAIRNRPLSKQVDRSSDTVARLRAEIELAADDRIDWQDVLVNFLDLGNTTLSQRTRAERDEALAKSWSIVSRYLFALPLSSAQKLMKYIDDTRLQIIAGAPIKVDRDDSWIAIWDGGREEHFDVVVCATGFHKPRFHAESNILQLVIDHTRQCVEPCVSSDLKVTLPNSSDPERIWTLGVASYLGAPLVNAVYQATQHAEAVARQISACNHLPGDESDGSFPLSQSRKHTDETL